MLVEFYHRGPGWHRVYAKARREARSRLLPMLLPPSTQAEYHRYEPEEMPRKQCPE